MDYIDAFRRSVRYHGNETALITDDGATISYNEFDERSTRLANALDERILDQWCAILAHNGIGPLDAMIAGQKRGLTTVQFPFRAGITELESMLTTANADGLIFDNASADLAQSVLDRTDIDSALDIGDKPVDHPAVDDYESTLEDAATDEPDPDTDEHAVFYTSGTTGDPKAVLFDQGFNRTGATRILPGYVLVFTLCCDCLGIFDYRFSICWRMEAEHAPGWRDSLSDDASLDRCLR